MITKIERPYTYLGVGRRYGVDQCTHPAVVEAYKTSHWGTSKEPTWDDIFDAAYREPWKFGCRIFDQPRVGDVILQLTGYYVDYYRPTYGLLPVRPAHIGTLYVYYYRRDVLALKAEARRSVDSVIRRSSPIPRQW